MAMVFPPARPWQTHEERLVDMALRSAMLTTPASALRLINMRRDSPNTAGMFPRWGTIDDVLHTDSQAAWRMERRYDFSGTQGSYSGSARNTGSGTW